MTPKERVKAVYENRCPDQVPLMLDLSHWYKKNYQIPFDLAGYKTVDQKLVDIHKQLEAVCYVEMGNFYELYFDDDSISDQVWTDGAGIFHHKIVTPLGDLEEQRVFEPISYSYNIRKHLLDSVKDLEIVCYIMERYRCRPIFEKYIAWQEALGELAFIYFQIPYSGLGYLISRNFGVEKTCMTMLDHPDEFKKAVDSINACNLRIVDEVIDGPFDVMFISDNFDSNVQNPCLFEEYVSSYYTEVASRLHSKGKYLAVHVDGEMRGCLANMAKCGVDCIDAATPAPMFSLTPAQARAEAGTELILSGGLPATVFGPLGTDEEFEQSVISWLETRMVSHRLIMAAGDQVCPDAPWYRIEMLPKLIEKYGKY